MATLFCGRCGRETVQNKTEKGHRCTGCGEPTGGAVIWFKKGRNAGGYGCVPPPEIQSIINNYK